MIYDDIIIGAGHNGLICACYLAKAGRKVLVVERRGVVGGAVCTEEIITGFKFDVGSSAHIMFPGTPIMGELGLADFGLQYIEMDPWAFYPVPGAAMGISFHRSVEQTCESIAKISAADAEAYKHFCERWGELNEGIWEVFLKPPTPGNAFATILKRNLFNSKSRKLWSSMDTSRLLMSSYGRVIEETFENQHVRAALAWLAAQSGPGPDEIATGDLVGWHPMIHKTGAWRARGGSGMLTQALARCLESMGGKIQLSAPVSAIKKGGGKARFAVETHAGSFEGKNVVGACHVQETILELLDPSLCPPDLRKRVSDLRVGNGFGMIVRHAVHELPAYMGQPRNELGISPCHSALQLLCPSMQHLRDNYVEYLAGQTPAVPSVLAMTFSALDPGLAPEGQHVLFGWAQYHPYELRTGENWDEIAEAEADKIWNVICSYAPNMKGKLIDRYIQTPLEIERKLALRRANVMHLEMSLDQMFFFRPLPELSSYKTPIPGLFLTGASTHPGGGVFGASGRNAAQVILKTK